MTKVKISIFFSQIGMKLTKKIDGDKIFLISNQKIKNRNNYTTEFEKSQRKIIQLVAKNLLRNTNPEEPEVTFLYQSEV